MFEEQVASRIREVAEINSETSVPLPERGRAAGDQWMERLAGNFDAFLLNLEFGISVARDPELRAKYGARLGAMRLYLARFLEQEEAAGNIDLPMPAAKLALVIRALGLGLAQEKLGDPDGVPDEVFGEFIEWLYTVLAPDGRPAPTG